MNKKAFTLIEFLVTIAILAILVLLGAPRLIGYVDKAELVRIQHDVRVMEQEIQIDNFQKEFNEWDRNNKKFGPLIIEKKLYEKEGQARHIDARHLSKGGVLTANNNKTSRDIEIKNDELGVGGDLISMDDGAGAPLIVDATYKIVPNQYSQKINTKLKGTFYSNSDGKVYYEHDKPLRIKDEDRNDSFSCEIPDPNYTFNHDDGILVDYHGESEELIIPDSFLVDGVCYPVRVIGTGAFMQGGFRKVVIPESVEVIMDNAFKDNKIERITIPLGVTEIGKDILYDNPIREGQLVVLGEPRDLPNRMHETVDRKYLTPTPGELGMVFDRRRGAVVSANLVGNGSRSPRSISIPDYFWVNGEKIAVTTIDDGAFQGLGLTSIKLPKFLEKIGDYAFSGNQLAKVGIPETVNYIGHYAFAFNQQKHTKSDIIRATIKSIVIDGVNRIREVHKGNLVNSSKQKLDNYDGITLRDFIWVTDLDEYDFENIERYIPDVDEGSQGPRVLAPMRQPEADEIVIRTAEDLNNVRNNLDKDYILMADIDLSSLDNWEPIGTTSNQFTGNFDGNGFKVSNLTIKNINKPYTGLFGVVEGVRNNEKVISNLIIDNAELLNNSSYSGILAGRTSYTEIKNVHVRNTRINVARRDTSHIGLIVGYLDYSIIENSSSRGTIQADNASYVGGLVGRARSSSIVNSYTISDISTYTENREASRTAGSSTGLLVGKFESRSKTNGVISDSYGKGTVNSGYKNGDQILYGHTGGAIGEIEVSSDGNTPTATIENVYISTQITRAPLHGTGKLIGNGSSTNISYKGVFYNDDLSLNNFDYSSIINNNYNDEQARKTSEQMKQSKSYEGWDFDDIWTIKEGKSYPTLRSNPEW